MASKNGRGLAGANGEAQRISSSKRDPFKPNRAAALVALRKSLARATEAELRDRLSRAIVSLEGRLA